MLDLKELVGTTHSIASAEGSINKSGIEAIKSFLKNNELSVPEEFDWNWVTIRGTLPKRLSVWERKQGTPIGDKLMPSLGQIAKEQYGSGKQYHFDIVAPPFNWQDGLYGMSGSCYHGKNPVEKIDAGFCARFYSSAVFKEAKGIGRIWLAQVEPGIIFAFNGYMHNEDRGFTLELSRVIAQKFDLFYYKTLLSIDNEWVNSEKGYCLGDHVHVKEFLKNHAVRRELYYHYNIPLPKPLFCVICKLEYGKNALKLKNNSYICNVCEPNAFECHDCQKLSLSDNCCKIRELVYCVSCVKDSFSFCCFCKDWKEKGKTKTAKIGRFRKSVCYDCLELKDFGICSSCQALTQKMELHSKKPQPCDCCGEPEWIPEDLKKLKYCKDCIKKIE